MEGWSDYIEEDQSPKFSSTFSKVRRKKRRSDFCMSKVCWPAALWEALKMLPAYNVFLLLLFGQRVWRRDFYEVIFIGRLWTPPSSPASGLQAKSQINMWTSDCLSSAADGKADISLSLSAISFLFQIIPFDLPLILLDNSTLQDSCSGCMRRASMV